MNIEEYKLFVNSNELIEYFSKTDSVFDKNNIPNNYYEKYYQDVDIKQLNDIQIKRATLSTPEYLRYITNKNLYSPKQIMDNLKDCLVGKDADILSNGPSFIDYKYDSNSNRLCLAIKRSVRCNRSPDIIVYNERVYTNHRSNEKYQCENNPFSIFISDYEIYTDFKTHCEELVKMNYIRINEFPHPADIKFTTETLFSPNNKCQLPLKYNIAGDDIYFRFECVTLPTETHCIQILKYMGVKNIDLYFANLYTKRNSNLYLCELDSNNNRVENPYNIFSDTLIRTFYQNYYNLNTEGVTLITDVVSNSDYRIKRTLNTIITSNNHLHVDFLNSKYNSENCPFYEYEELMLKFHLISKITCFTLIKYLIFVYKEYNSDHAKNFLNSFLSGVKTLTTVFNPVTYVSINFSLRYHSRLSLLTHYALYGKNKNLIYRTEFESLLPNIDKLPLDFNPILYKYLYEDLQHLTDEGACIHYLNYGIKENREYKCSFQKYRDIQKLLPSNFDPMKYKMLNINIDSFDSIYLCIHYIEIGSKKGLLFE